MEECLIYRFENVSLYNLVRVILGKLNPRYIQYRKRLLVDA